MLTINQPLVLATVQEFEISNIFINFVEGKISASYIIKNESGEIVQGGDVQFSGEEAKTFWKEFTSKQSMYAMVAQKMSIPVAPEVVIPDTLQE